MSAHTNLGYQLLLSPSWLGNFQEKGPFRILRRSPPIGREGGDVIPGEWTPVDVGARAYIAESSKEIYPGQTQLGKESPGDRKEEAICMIVPNVILARIIIDETETDSDIVQYNGSNYRCVRSQGPDAELGVTSITAVRIQPRDLPADVPPYP